MKRSRFTLHFATWLACLAVLLASFAPSISRIVAAQRTQVASAVSEMRGIAAVATLAAAANAAICRTADDGQAVPASAHHAHPLPAAQSAHHAAAPAARPVPVEPAGHDEHFKGCPFCHTTAASFALLPLVLSFFAGEAGTAIPPVFATILPIARASRTPVQSRAPPAAIRLS